MIGGIGTAHASAQHSHRLLKAATTMLVSLAALLPWQTMPVVSWLTRPASFPSLIFARQCSHCWSNWGQHRCRQWYAASYASVESYCGWLFSNHAQTYCWAMDDSKLAAELDSHVCSSLHFHVQCTLHVNYHYPTRMSSNFPERVRERERDLPITQSRFGISWTMVDCGWQRHAQKRDSMRWCDMWSKEWQCTDESCGYGSIDQPNQATCLQNPPTRLSIVNIDGKAAQQHQGLHSCPCWPQCWTACKCLQLWPTKRPKSKPWLLVGAWRWLHWQEGPRF